MDYLLYNEGRESEECRKASESVIRDWWLPLCAGASLALWTVICDLLLS